MQKQRAIIIGGSVGGLFAANFLRELAWQVDVYERVAEDLAGRGAGIGTHEELFGVMRRLGIAIDDSIGVRVSERVCLDASGNAIHRLGSHHLMSHWVRIYGPLRERLPAASYHAGANFVDFSDDDDQVVAHFEDGSSARADMLIGADGGRSSVRGCLFPDVHPRYAGYIGWRGIIEESALPASLRERLGDAYYFGLPPGEMMLAYPVPGRYWNYVWYRPTPEAELANLGTGARGPHVRPELAKELKDIARATLAPLLAELVERSEPFYQAIYDLETPRIAAARVALLGDAAFVARPHVGMGVTKAALDALCLYRSLQIHAGDLDAALARYERLRGEFGRRCVARARRLGAYIEARARPDRGWTEEQIDQRPERVMREVAASLSDIPELGLEI